MIFTLPSTASVGDSFRIVSRSTNGYRIAQNASQSISFLSLTTTTGTGGYIESVNYSTGIAYAAIEVICIIANTSWVVVTSHGQFNVV